MDDILSNIKLAANGTPYIGVVPSTCTDMPWAGYDLYDLDMEITIKNAWQEGYKQGFADGCNFWESFSQKGKDE